VRQDHVTYTPSADPFADRPATVGQDRTLRNTGLKADVAYAAGNHNVKVGGTILSTMLRLRRPVQYADRVPDFMGSLEA
jgi:hypothetical protein